MGDGAPRATQPPDGGGGAENGGDTDNPEGTPIALNDAHASQASKELQQASGTDLEAFLRAQKSNESTAAENADNLFMNDLRATTNSGRSARGKRVKSRFSPRPYEQAGRNAESKDVENTAAPATTDAEQNENDPSDSTATSKTNERGKDDPDADATAVRDAASEAASEEQADGSTDPASGGVEEPATNKEADRPRNPKKPRTRGRRKEKSTNADKESATAPKVGAENPWTKAREVLLRQKLHTKAAKIEYEDLKLYKKYYELAQATHYRVIPDTYPRRPTTEDEMMALYLWRTKKIHLEGPPRFIVETHTLRERLALEQIQRDLLTYCLHIDTPGQLRMPAETAKYHFYTQMLAKNQTADGPTDVVVDLMTDVLSISVSAASRRAILKFVRPELRDKWEGYVLPFPFGAVTLRAASYFEQEDKRDGLDQETVKLLYSCYLIGKAGLALEDVHAIAKALGGGTPLLNIEPIEPTGAKTLDPYMTKVTYNSVEAPPGIEHVRELTVQQGETTFKIGLHQPRLATRQPCSVCLETTHFRNKCPNKDKADEVRAPYVKEIEIPASMAPEFETAAADLEAVRAQMARMRAKLAPEIAPSANGDSATDANSESKDEAPKSADEQKNKSSKPKKKSSKNAKKAQIGILLNASKRMHGGVETRLIKLGDSDLPSHLTVLTTDLVPEFLS